MKKFVKFLIVLVLSTVVYSVGAQDEERNALRDVEEQSTYGRNWFVSLGGNLNLLTSEQDSEVALGDRLKLGGALTVGKWFNPNFGARIQVMGGALRGFNYTDQRGGYYVWDNYHHQKDPAFPMGLKEEKNLPSFVKGAYPDFKYTTGKDILSTGEKRIGIWQDFNYASATFDLMANFSNLFRGYYKESFFEFIPFVGFGLLHAFDNDLTNPNFNHFVVKLGFRTNFNITDKFAIYLEPMANATTEEFDGYVGTAFGDGFLNLGLGLQYTFNKGFAGSLAQITADEIDRLNRKINNNRYLIDNHQNILERQQNLLDRLKKCCDENTKEVVTQVIETSTLSLPEYVRFGLDSYVIESTEQRKIVEVADYLKKNPNSNILIVGYADRKTGNPPYNFKLSQKRVDAVAAELRRLGISSNRIYSEWKGDKEQPFPQNEWNRVVIMIERK